MATVHGKNTKVTLNAVDISAFSNSTAFNRTADSHDVTCYGQNGHVFASGLTNGTVTISGVFDAAASATPAVVFNTLLASGQEVAFVFQANGTGTGKPARSCNVIVTGYDETSPVADMVTWSGTLQINGTVSTTAQS